MAIPKLQAYALPEASDIPANKVNWAFEPSRAALLIHDMQEYFLNFWGENSAMMERVVANIAALREFCKQNHIPVFYTAQPKEQSDEDRALLNDMWGPGLTRSPEQQQVIAALAPDDSDTVLVKWRYSAFHRSPLEEKLKEAGRDQLIITGVYAHIGCMTTATDAFMRDIKPFFVADALADFSREEHLMALNYVAGRSGRVVMTEELLPLPASKAALRALVRAGGAAALAPHVPPACLRLYMQAEAEGDILDGRAFGIAVLSRLRAMDAAGLRAVRGAAEGLENRLAAAVQGAGTLDELVQAMRTKRYATARLRRLVLDAALGYTGDLPALPPYLHVLGANETGLAVLRCARQAALLPLSHSLADLAARSAPAARVAAAHAAAEDLTALCLRHPAPMGAAYTAKPVFPTSGAK